MKAKKIVTILLLIFVAGSVAYMVMKEVTAKPAKESAEQSAPAKQDTKLIVYYFHGDVRCATCHKLETYAKEAMDSFFPDALASGKIIWEATNIDRPENRHFIDDYQLVTKSVILSSLNNGKEAKWKNLDQIWQKVGNKESYMQYIREGIESFLEETK